MVTRFAALLAVLVFGATCGGATAPPPALDQCPEPRGEFPFTDCAILEGVAVDANGSPLPGLAVRVDSFVPHSGYAYVSDATVTDGSGGFYLVIERVNRLTPPTAPDTATVEVKAYSEPDSKPGSAVVGRAPVLLRFAPLGLPVDRTVATAHFDLE